MPDDGAISIFRSMDTMDGGTFEACLADLKIWVEA
jgi:hypothetical protein